MCHRLAEIPFSDWPFFALSLYLSYQIYSRLARNGRTVASSVPEQCKLRDLLASPSSLMFTIGDSSFSILTIANAPALFITQQYWLPPCSAQCAHTMCGIAASIGLQLNWINSLSVLIMAFNWIIIVHFILFFCSGREKSSKLAALTLMCPPRAYSHLHTSSLGISSFIRCCCVMATNMKISHDEKYSTATAGSVVRRAHAWHRLFQSRQFAFLIPHRVYVWENEI